MGSSISHQNIETASAVRAETVTGTHHFTVFGYSLTRGIGVGNYITSDVFSIGGYDWVIQYYPDGDAEETKGYISFFLYLTSENIVADVKARYDFTILQQNGRHSDMTWTSTRLLTFRSTTDTYYSSWGCRKFVEIPKFEASKCLKDDAFTLKCSVTVVKGIKLEAISLYGVAVPSSNFNKNLANLLKSGTGSDVTFVVKGERFNAHRCVLAAQSVVFHAELFGGMKEKWTDTIRINDMEAPVFKSLLYFIYTDSVPDFQGTTADDDEKHDPSLMAQHLLVAADRYALERLGLMCEDVLCKNLNVSNAATVLTLAERHNCSQLKAQCLKLLSSAEVFKKVAPTDEFNNMLKICPSLLKDINALCLK